MILSGWNRVAMRSTACRSAASDSVGVRAIMLSPIADSFTLPVGYTINGKLTRGNGSSPTTDYRLPTTASQAG